MATCPICGLPSTDFVEAGEPNCIITGGDRCYRRGFERLKADLALYQEAIGAADQMRTQGIMLAANLGDCGEAAGNLLRPLLTRYDLARSKLPDRATKGEKHGT